MHSFCDGNAMQTTHIPIWEFPIKRNYYKMWSSSFGIIPFYEMLMGWVHNKHVNQSREQKREWAGRKIYFTLRFLIGLPCICSCNGIRWNFRMIYWSMRLIISLKHTRKRTCMRLRHSICIGIERRTPLNSHILKPIKSTCIPSK